MAGSVRQDDRRYRSAPQEWVRTRRYPVAGMSAEGKITTSALTPGTRILAVVGGTSGLDVAHLADIGRGALTVTVEKVLPTHGPGRRRYNVLTDQGTIHSCAPSQTHYLARQDMSERCLVCGMVATLDPAFHAERYDHAPEVRRGERLRWDGASFAPVAEDAPVRWGTRAGMAAREARARTAVAAVDPRLTPEARAAARDALTLMAAGDCTCHLDCHQDSHSGEWHQHEDEPCPLHPDAPTVG